MRSKPHMLAMLGAAAALATAKSGATREPEKQKPVERWCGQRKIGRNEPCPCASGKKYKKCCGSPLNGSGDANG